MAGTEESTAEFQKLFDAVSNWGRWGEDDALGTLNLIDPAVVRRAVGLVESGEQVSCGRTVGFRRSPVAKDFVLHFMTVSGADVPDEGEGAASDWVGLGLHGVSFTHVDGHSHGFWNGQMYNGRKKDLVTTDRGALAGGVEPMFNGVTTRGILVDGPDLLGVPFVAPGTALEPRDLENWFNRVGILPEPGDMLFVRTGYGEDAYPSDEIPSAGLSARCMPLLREADISVLVSDGISDVQPSGYKGIVTPVHKLGLAAMGLWLVDIAALKDLSEKCGMTGRYQFLAMLAPIPIRRATGSLVNPIAVF